MAAPPRVLSPLATKILKELHDRFLAAPPLPTIAERTKVSGTLRGDVQTIFKVVAVLAPRAWRGHLGVDYALDSFEGFGELRVGAWRAYPAAGTPDADPYSKARAARKAYLPAWNHRRTALLCAARQVPGGNCGAAAPIVSAVLRHPPASGPSIRQHRISSPSPRAKACNPRFTPRGAL